MEKINEFKQNEKSIPLTEVKPKEMSDTQKLCSAFNEKTNKNVHHSHEPAPGFERKKSFSQTNPREEDFPPSKRKRSLDLIETPIDILVKQEPIQPRYTEMDLDPGTTTVLDLEPEDNTQNQFQENFWMNCGLNHFLFYFTFFEAKNLFFKTLAPDYEEVSSVSDEIEILTVDDNGKTDEEEAMWVLLASSFILLLVAAVELLD